MTRDFTVATFIVWQDKILLHQHPKIPKLLPPGGHIEPDELPDEAARREALEETGVQIELIGELAPKSLEAGSPLPLVRPRGIQLEFIKPEHEHIDLIYFAKPIQGYDGALLKPFRWYSNHELSAAPQEIRLWCQIALKELGTPSLVCN